MPSVYDQAKQQVRQQVWDALTAAEAVHDADVYGRIPDFRGKELAARQLAALPRWKAAQIVKAVPDKAQHPVRAAALADGKTVYMAAPKLATSKPFYLLDPSRLDVPPAEAASSAKAAVIAPGVDVDDMQPVDVIVLGSVAVNHAGVRIGKGAGYSDLEFALLAEAGLVSDETLVVTTVHPLQVVDADIPFGPHDVTVDIIVTTDGVITTSDRRRTSGILWDQLPPEKITAIPVLARRARTARHFPA
ncbi:5-formyltetrahydrofolate cyclo-ligase [Yinghuangia sp. ASG 101]|nr:5-formyltetrahydrofolate cyclo-ligase [Yinghuangia sp. ASG 101]UGQ13702.1 5-formyltetrahydrofolate cyclo-ligase [Yinghuangia sp. ASG 101]